MMPLPPAGGSRTPALKRNASDDLADLMADMTMGKGKAPSAVGRGKRPRAEPSRSPTPEPVAAPKSLKRKASIDESGDAGPSSLAGPSTEPPKRSRLAPKGQIEKSYAGGDRDFRNPDGSSVHKPLQGPVSVHFGHGTVVVGNGGAVKIDHPDGTTVLSREGEKPTVLKPMFKAPGSLPGGARLEHLDGGDARVYLPDRVVTHFHSGLTRTEMNTALSGQRGFFETDSDGAHRFVEARDP